MSVINRMLQELEERREDAMQSRLPGLVRAVPARGAYVVKHLPWRNMLGVSLLLLIGVLSWRLAAQWQSARLHPAPQTTTDDAMPHAPALQSASMLPPLAVSVAPRLRASEPAPEMNSDLVQPATAAPALASAPATTLKSDADGVPALASPPAVSQKFTIEKTSSAKTAKGELEILVAAPHPPLADATAQDKNAVQKFAVGSDIATPMKQISKEQSADYRYREALALINQGRMQEGQTLLDEALRLDPRNLAARQVLLGVYLETKRYAEAEQLLQDALQLNLAPAVNAPALARIQVERGEQVLALSTLEKYLGTATESAAYHGFYAALLQRAGRHAEAIAEFQFALKRQPNQANWWLGLGVSLQNEKRNAEAEQAYTRARAANTLGPELLAFIDQRLKQLQAAR